MRPVGGQRQGRQRGCERERSRRREQSSVRLPANPREGDDDREGGEHQQRGRKLPPARDTEVVHRDLEVLAVATERSLRVEQRARVVDVVRERVDVRPQLTAKREHDCSDTERRRQAGGRQADRSATRSLRSSEQRERRQRRGHHGRQVQLEEHRDRHERARSGESTAKPEPAGEGRDRERREHGQSRLVPAGGQRERIDEEARDDSCTRSARAPAATARSPRAATASQIPSSRYAPRQPPTPIAAACA